MQQRACPVLPHAAFYRSLRTDELLLDHIMFRHRLMARLRAEAWPVAAHLAQPPAGASLALAAQRLLRRLCVAAR